MNMSERDGKLNLGRLRPAFTPSVIKGGGGAKELERSGK